MVELELLIDLHHDGERQGPGDASDTRLSVALSGLKKRKGLRVADIGCGTGASTLVLARELDAHITAVDLIDKFLRILDRRATEEGLGDRITTLSASMDDLPFKEESFDAIWSEGAIYNMGFSNGIQSMRRFLKPNGILALSELTWMTCKRPAEIEAHWEKEYPEVDTASNKIRILEEYGYTPLGYFALSERSWLDNYYRPLQRRFDNFLSRHDDSDAARSIVVAEKNEIDLYKRYSAFVSYGYYIAKRTSES